MASVEFKEIYKKFDSFHAVKNISFQIPSNSVSCLLGENGAGKSTLMKILAGYLKQDSGEILINDKTLKLKSTTDAINNGIAMLYQHFMLIDDFTVFENIILGNEKTKNFSLNIKEMKIEINDLNLKYNLNLDLDSKISELSVGEQQKTEILNILYRNPEIIILDEPTAVLSPNEVNSLFEIIRVFKKEGKTIILITHKLKEVMDICDEVAVLRKGELVFKSEIKDIDINKLAYEITGEVINEYKIEEKAIKELQPLIEIENLNIFENSKLDIHLKPFEIYGICGVEGNGQNEIIDFILGIKNFKCSRTKFLTDKISLVPDDRLKKGFIKEFTLPENLFLKSEFKYYQKKYLNDKAENLINNFDIRLPSLDSEISSLSGGNQQKVILAREIDLNSDVLILHNPTRGIDLKSSELMYKKIDEERNKGKSILLISSDTDEILRLSDKISILYKGNFLKTFNRKEINELNNSEISIALGKLMIGINETE